MTDSKSKAIAAPSIDWSRSLPQLDKACGVFEIDTFYEFRKAMFGRMEGR